MAKIEFGYFSRSTVKPIDKIFNLEKEKKLIIEFLRHNEWFMVSGIRRVGKTTLVRSLLKHLGIRNIYINLWNIDEDRPYDDFIYRLSRELLSYVDRSIKSKLKGIEEISLLGIRVKLKHKEKEFYLDELLEQILRKHRIVIVIDEIQEIEKNLKKFSKLLSALHDQFAPRLSVVILGSIASIRHLFKGDMSETEPLFGRIIREFNITPFSISEAKQFLLAGFEECNIDINTEDIEKAISYLGTITGWLVEFGRQYVIEKRALGSVEVDKIIETAYEHSKTIVYGEIARMLKGKKRFDVYLRILKLIANNPYIGLAEISRALSRSKPTILQYLEFLMFRNIVYGENGRYNIIDPLYRRTILAPNFEIEVKKRL